MAGVKGKCQLKGFVLRACTPLSACSPGVHRGPRRQDRQEEVEEARACGEAPLCRGQAWGAAAAHTC